jgi:hypothetical protein
MTANILLQSYLVAWIFWLSLSLGCFGLMLLHHVVRGRWGLVIIRLLEAGAKTLPLMAIGFVPIALGKSSLYVWARPDVHDRIINARHWYLNPGFWTARAVFFFAFWIGMTALLTRWTAEEDRTGNADLGQKRSNISAPGLVAFVLTVTFSSIDWVMSLEPHWHSTIFGVLSLVGEGLGALALTTLIVLVGSRSKPFAGLVTPALTRDLGNLMLTLTMVWGYIALSQYLIIWSANLTEETHYFIARTKPGWNLLGTGLVLGQFFFPFLLLLSTALKRSVRMLGFVAGWILAMRVVDVIWTVSPSFRDEAGHSVLLDLALMAAMGVVWLGWFAAIRRRSAPLPSYDPRLMETASHA